MSQTFRKTGLAVALTAALGGLSLQQAHAININQDGLGDALIFPYYTVRSGWETYIQLVNTSARTAILKIRFREAKNSREVRDFNLILSPHDVWTGNITLTADGKGARVKTDDKSCTSPLLPTTGVAGESGFTGVDFTNYGYNGMVGAVDGGGTGIERTQEGYLEVFLMGLSDPAVSMTDSSSVITYNSKHVNGVPRNCAAVDQALIAPIPDRGVVGTVMENFPDDMGIANVIKGYSTLIRVAEGRAAGVEPTTIADCRVTKVYASGDDGPNFDRCELPNMAVTLDDSKASLVIRQDTGFVSNTDVVSALLMRNQLINQWTTANVTDAATDWVITFPNKHVYTDGVVPAAKPFHNTFTGQSCDPYTLYLYDREEVSEVKATSTDFSPKPPAGQPASLCYEVNVLNFNNKPVLGSSVQTSVTTPASMGERGWGLITLTDGATTQLVGSVGAIATTYNGLPVIGFSITTRGGSNYATVQPHAYTRLITP